MSVFSIRRSVLPFLLFGLLTGSASVASAAITTDERVDALPEQHRVWLEQEVLYIISDTEKDVFLGLESELERESFVEAFWRKRDTNPSTPENEYRDEHYERFEYATKFLGRDTFLKGWQTDRGRYHILIGKPNNVQNMEGRDGIYPAELWFYNEPNLKRYGLPPFFFLLFFRRNGAGEFKLYSPVADGPQELLTGVNTVSMDFRDDQEMAYDRLRQIDPELAAASLSFRTDEGDTAQFQAVSFGTLELMDDIRNVPFFRLDTTYAERLDFERGSVESDYLFTFVPGFGMMDVLPGPDGIHYVHWTVEMEPQYVALVRDPDSGQHGSIFIVTVEVTPKGQPDQLAVQYRNENFLRLSDAQARNNLRSPFSYSGMIPLVSGEFDVRVILRNRACPGRDEQNCRKAYTLFDAGVVIPTDGAEEPALGDLMMGYSTQRKDDRLYRPYRFGNLEFLPNPQRVYSIGDPVVVAVHPVAAPTGARVKFEIIEADTPAGALIETTLPVAGLVDEPLAPELLLEQFSGGRYEVVATLLGPDGDTLATKRESFTVSPRTTINRAGVRGSSPYIQPEVPGVVSMSLGDQYMGMERFAEAKAQFERALAQNGKLGPAREKLARFALEEEDPARVVELLEPVYRQVRDRFEVVRPLGEAYFHQGSHEKAIEALETAIMLRRPDSQVLNILASSYYESGNLMKAQEVLQRSLGLDSDQPEVKQMLDKVNADIKVSGAPER